MIDIATWMKKFLQTLNETFTNRVWFVGLQGSYGRPAAFAFRQKEKVEKFMEI